MFLHCSRSVVDTPEITIIWDMQIQTDHYISANKPDIIVKNKVKKFCMIIDIAVPSDYNVVQKKAEKKTKYKALEIEIKRMWNVRAKTVPIVIGAAGLVSKNMRKYLKEVPGDHNIELMQKVVILKTAHIIRRVI